MYVSYMCIYIHRIKLVRKPYICYIYVHHIYIHTYIYIYIYIYISYIYMYRYGSPRLYVYI